MADNSESWRNRFPMECGETFKPNGGDVMVLVDLPTDGPMFRIAEGPMKGEMAELGVEEFYRQLYLAARTAVWDEGESGSGDDRDILANLRFNGEGVSLSLYDGGKVLDEAWFTWDEVEQEKELPLSSARLSPEESGSGPVTRVEVLDDVRTAMVHYPKIDHEQEVEVLGLLAKRMGDVDAGDDVHFYVKNALEDAGVAREERIAIAEMFE